MLHLPNTSGIRFFYCGCCFFAALIVLIFPTACSESNQNQKALKSSVEQGFSFFEVGPETRFSDHLKKTLEKNLGSAAFESRNVIDLTFGRPQLIEQNFPAVAQLNLSLNGEFGQRVEHNTKRLIFRYLPESALPFKSVDWMFSGLSLKPLYSRIKAQKGGENLEITLTERYGQPSEVFCGKAPNRCLYWMYAEDLLILTMGENRRMELDYEIKIYYLNNLKELIASEKTEKARLEKERRKALEKAF